MSELQIILALAATGEIVIEIFKPLLNPLVARARLPEDVNVYLYLSATLGLLLAAYYNVNLLAAVGLPDTGGATHTIGIAVTGLVLGRGMNGVHDALATLAGRRGS